MKRDIADKNNYFDLADEFYKENEILLCDVEKIVDSISRNENPDIPCTQTIEVILALHNFDVKHSGSDYSSVLKSTIVGNKPCTFHERVSELSLIVYSLEGNSSLVLIVAALALHENRVLTKNLNALPDFNKIDDELQDVPI